MVFALDQVTLFGGSPAFSRKTCQWDGSHWTEWQDIGPAPRWLHAMAYDSDRHRIVLFGGLAILVGTEQPAGPGAFLAETWEHEVMAKPVTIESLVIHPTSVKGASGFNTLEKYVSVTATLSASRLLPTNVEITFAISNAWTTEKTVRYLTVPAGQKSAEDELSFDVPPVTKKGPYQVTAKYAGSSASATLTIT
jgi:hypothetical protein